MGIRIVKAARRVPDFVVTNDDLSRMVETSDEWIYSRTGIKTRHISRGENVSSMSSDVFRQLCDGTGYAPSDIELLVLSTVSPDYQTPPSSAIVLKETQAKNAFAFDMNAACTGFIYGLSVADKYLCSGTRKTAIVISADVLTNLADWEDRSTCVLFGDGAGGVLLEYAEDAPGVLAEDLHTDGEMAMRMSGGKLPVRNAWFKEDAPEQPYMQMDGRAIYEFTVREVPKSVNRALEKAGLTMDDIKYVVPHQANARIIEAIAKKLKAPMDKFFVSIQDFGNTSSSSVPIALSLMCDRELLTRGDKIVFTGFGAGLTWGTVIYEW